MRKAIKSAEHPVRAFNLRPLALEEAVSVRLKVKRAPVPAKESDKITLARVIREMAQPRIAKSARQEKHLLKLANYSEWHSL